MIEAYIEAHSKTAVSLARGKADFRQDFHPQIRRCDLVRKWILHHTFGTGEEKPSNASVRWSLADSGS